MRNISSQSPKYWKQEVIRTRNPVQSLREDKKRNLESLGFGSSQRMATNMKNSYMDSHLPILPEVKKIRKKEKVLTLKPVIFSVYSIQKPD